MPLLKFFFSCFLFVLFLTDLSAQDSNSADELVTPIDSMTTEAIKWEYTFAGDKRYSVLHELAGEVFVPAGYKSGGGQIAEVPAGDIWVKVDKTQIKFSGVEGLKSYHIMQQFQDKIGYIYEVMDTDGRPGKFKVVLDDDKFVFLLYFNSKHLGEHTFLLPEKMAEQKAEEETHFTPQSQIFVRNYTNLLDKEVFPFTVIEDRSKDIRPRKIDVSENLKFSFSEYTIQSPQGSHSIKKARTLATGRLPDNPSVVAVIEVEVKGKPNRINILINYKQEIEAINIGETSYQLKP